ncbi:MAG TPA: type VI secretion system contractile sheath large subunit [Acetobacteraceae bacterium]|nr:type VI secretion system contractile sheath large subunit [Acetobacteraceae bacterium]
MDDVNLAVDLPAAEAPDETVAAPAVRDAVLTGRYVGNRDAALADAFRDFLGAPSGEAIGHWFGAERGTRLRVDPQALRDAVDRDIATIDAMLSEQVDAILHHPRLRRLEATWRGVAWLADGVELSNRLKIKLLNVGWPEICRDLDRAIEFDQSQLFRKVYEEEFGTPGGEPYGLLLVDHEVRHRPGAESRTDDVSAMTSLSGIAAAAFSPLIVGASPALLEADQFADLATSTDITAPLRNADHARWRSLAGRADMRFVGVALPRVLARPPWEDDGTRADGFRYREYAPTNEDRVWMNAAFAFASVVARAFATFGWPADVRGAETDRVGGGLVTDVPLEPFSTDPDHVWVRNPVELVLTEQQEHALLDAGLMPLSSVPFSHELVFGSVRSLQVPQRYQGANANAAEANARLSTQINAILCASRFAHHLKMRGRQMIGSFKTANEIERSLQAWLIEYVNGNLSATGESRARFPLVAGKVTVNELPGKPGSFGCVVHLQPHYQLDDISAAFQLVTDISGR